VGDPKLESPFYRFLGEVIVPPCMGSIFRNLLSPVCTENLNPEVVVMESAEDGERF